MNSVGLTKEQVARIAKELFLEHHPGHEEWFDLTWDVIADHRSRAEITGRAELPRGLGASGRGSPLMRTMARDAVILFEVFMEKYPVVAEELRHRLSTIAKKHGKSDTEVKRMRDVLEKKLAAVPEFIVWSWDAKKKICTRRELSWKTIADEILPTKPQFDLFLAEGVASAYNKDKDREIPLPKVRGCLYRLLVLFLMHRGTLLPIVESFLKAWQLNNVPLAEDGSLMDTNRLVEKYLKSAVSTLKNKIQPHVANFSIPAKEKNKAANSGYMCVGYFTYCIIIRRNEEPWFTLSFT